MAEAPAGKLEKRFLRRHPEKSEFNQYWYSPATIAAMVEECVPVLRDGGRVAFLSTPSVYFSLPVDLREKAALFDLDEQWAKEPDFVCYDFSEPEAFSDELRGSFAMVVIDPPFITREVWENYATTARALLPAGEDGSIDGRVLGSTIAENEEMMAELLGTKACVFKPSIPNLVYQYQFYTNYDTTALAVKNPEIPDFDDE